MERNNIFRGAGKQATYAKTAYELLMTGDWVTNLDIVVKADKVEKEDKEWHIKMALYRRAQKGNPSLTQRHRR